MLIKFQFYKKTKRRWKYKAQSVDNGRCTSMEKKHTELILYRDFYKYPPKEITVEI